MTLESTFYTIAIAYMTINIILLLGIGIGLFMLLKTFMEIREQINNKVNQIQDTFRNPENLAASIGSSLIRSAFKNAGKIFKKS